MNFGIGPGEVFDGFFFQFVGVFVADGHEVVALLSKLLDQLRSMIDPSTKHDGLSGPAKDLVSLLLPLNDNVSGDLHTPRFCLGCRPLPG